jgi:hypothetical protein
MAQVYLSPEKFIRCYDRLAPLHSAQRLTLFAIDEAHCVSVRLALHCLALPCRALPCLALPCRALPCRALPCLAWLCLALPCRALNCLALPCRALPGSAAHSGVAAVLARQSF